jgi:hypothetical protein
MLKVPKKGFRFWPDHEVPQTADDRAAQSHRDRFEAFMRTLRPRRHDRLLDVGVGLGGARSTHLLAERYPWRSRVTALAMYDSPAFRVRHPEIALVTWDGCRMDFPDRAFDICTANGVIERIASFDRQRAFIRESCRVSGAVWFSTRNRWLPAFVRRAGEDAVRLLTLPEIRRCVPDGWDMDVTRRYALGVTVGFDILLRRGEH